MLINICFSTFFEQIQNRFENNTQNDPRTQQKVTRGIQIAEKISQEPENGYRRPKNGHPIQESGHQTLKNGHPIQENGHQTLEIETGLRFCDRCGCTRVRGYAKTPAAAGLARGVRGPNILIDPHRACWHISAF